MYSTMLDFFLKHAEKLWSSQYSKLWFVPDDPDEERVKLVKSKTAHYLLRAEKIYQQHLADSAKPSAHSQVNVQSL